MADAGKMRTDPATVATRGTVNLPAEIRKALGIAESGELSFEDDRGVTILGCGEPWRILEA